MRPRPHLLLIAAVLAGAAGCRLWSETQRSPAPAVRITLIGLNDIHGNVESKEVRIGAGEEAAIVRVGGAEILAAYLDAARAQNPGRTLVLDAGDMYQGTLLSNHYQGRSVLAALNEAGIDASTFGNHEFDYGAVKGDSKGADPLGAVKALVAEAGFPYLSANVVDAEDPARLPLGDDRPASLARSKIFDLGGVTVGVVGATTATTPAIQIPANVRGLAFRKLADSVPEEAERLRRDGAHVVVLLAHAGGACDMREPAERGDRGCAGATKDEITELLDAAGPEVVDVVLAGHIHAPQAHFIRGVPVVQTPGFGTSFSRIDLWVDPAEPASAPRGKRITRAVVHRPTFLCHEVFANHRTCNPDEVAWGGSYPDTLGERGPATYAGVRIEPRASVAARLAPYRAGIEAITSRLIGDLPSALPYDRFGESAASNCVVDAAKEAVEARVGRRLDAAVFHSGRIRTALPRGPLRYGRLFDVLPFNDAGVVARLTGAELDALGRELTVTPKRIVVVSQGWRTRYVDPPSFPRHRGFLGADGRALGAERLHHILLEDHTVLSIESVFTHVRTEGRIDFVGETIRDLVADRIADRRRGLPASCRSPSTGRSVAVPGSESSLRHQDSRLRLNFRLISLIPLRYSR